MANYSMTDPEYWRIPERFAPVAGRPTDRKSFFFVGDPDDVDSPVAVVLDLPPGRVIVRHAHTCARFEVVVRGSIIESDGRTYHPGDVMVAARGELYGPRVAGPEGCTVVEFFSDQTGVTHVQTETEDGDHVTVRLLEGERFPANSVGVAWAVETEARVLAEAATAPPG